MIRLGIVGPGLIWENVHRRIVGAMDDAFRVTAFSATSAHSREKVAREYPGTAFFPDYQDLARSDLVDAVVVLTPIPLNAPVATAALRAGKIVIMEKPMGASLQEGLDLERTRQETGGRVFVLEQAAYRPVYDALAEVLRSGDLGTLVLYDQVAHGLFDAGQHVTRGYGATAWRIHPEFPLGTLWDGGHHQIAALNELFGLPESVIASGRRLRPEYGDYDHVLALLEYPNGMRGVFSFSDDMGGGRDYFNVRGSLGVAYIEDGRLYLNDREGATREVATSSERAHERMWRAIAASLNGGSEARYGLAEGLRDLRLLDAIRRAVESGERALL